MPFRERATQSCMNQYLEVTQFGKPITQLISQLVDPHRNEEIRDTRKFARSFIKTHAFKYNVIDRFLFVFEYNRFNKKKRSTDRLDEGFYTDAFLQRIIRCVYIYKWHAFVVIKTMAAIKRFVAMKEKSQQKKNVHRNCSITRHKSLWIYPSYYCISLSRNLWSYSKLNKLSNNHLQRWTMFICAGIVCFLLTYFS